MNMENMKETYALYKVLRAGMYTFEEFTEMLNACLGDEE